MNKIVTFGVIASGALALAACGAKKEEAPMEAPEVMMPEGETPAPPETPTMAETPAADEAAAAAEDQDPTSNPIGPGAGKQK